jgi:hypothetical protein
MNRKAFLLGFFASGGQVLLLRELVSSLNGDELFIGTALFGWLIAVALGAWLGGRERPELSVRTLLRIGALLAPAGVAAARLAPGLLGIRAGEAVPLTTAILISALAMIPVGLAAGWLFPAITRERQVAPDAVVTVYLFEGLGAFASGVVITLVVGSVLSTLAASLGLMVLVFGGSFLVQKSVSGVGRAVTVFVSLVMLVGLGFLSRPLEKTFDNHKYRGWDVAASFDTPYSHETLLEREGTLALLTDSRIEASTGNTALDENRVLPALAYNPNIKSVLVTGRTEFGLAGALDSLGITSVTAVDPREKLTSVLRQIGVDGGQVERVHAPPVRFLNRTAASTAYDLVILETGNLASYRAASMVTPEFLSDVRRVLSDSGIVALAASYDTDRYVTAETAELLQSLQATFAVAFDHVTIWPGEVTVLLASGTDLFDVPYDTVIARLRGLPYEPQFVSEQYLFDRLDPFRIERLESELGDGTVNTVNRPIIMQRQLAYDGRRHKADATIIGIARDRLLWAILVPVLIIALLAGTAFGKRRMRRYGLFLYFVAGLVSLSLELLAFYVYQSRVGSLYSEMALLIGTFMLGLAVGTWYTVRYGGQRGMELPALLTLLVATLLYRFMTQAVSDAALLMYHVLFLFTTAAATGSLFVGATARYYTVLGNTNRGTGYALELAGSSLGALLAAAVLLPLFGLDTVLTAAAILVAVTAAGAVVTYLPGGEG